jgi:hypothetical protein
MDEEPQEELPPQIKTVFPVGLVSSNGRGSLRRLKRPAVAVEIESGSTAALANGSESGTTETRISGHVL